VQRHTFGTLSRRAVVAGTVVLGVGCLGNGDSGSQPADGGSADGDGTAGATEGSTDGNVSQEGTGAGALTLASPAFEHGERIPERYGYEAENVNPPLEVEGVPAGAASLALIVDDPDAVEPAGEVWDHWVVWNVPPDTESIPEDWTPTEGDQGTNDFGEVGYDGPNPPDREHRYRFRLFALDVTLDLPTETDATDLADAMGGHVLARAKLVGTFPP